MVFDSRDSYIFGKDFPLRSDMFFKFKKLSRTGYRIHFLQGLVLVWSLFLYIGVPISWAAEKTAEVNSEVKPHRWAAIRLANVNQGATLEVKLHLDGHATVVLVSGTQLKSYPKVARPLFRTETRDRAIFSITAPKSDDYFLIVDNRKGDTKRKYSLSITAKLDLSGKRSLGEKKLTGTNSLKVLSQVIQTAFVVDPLKFKLTTCESTNTITRGETIYLCQEYLEEIKGRFRDKREANEIILFELMKEAGYVLLRRWKYPLIDSPHVKDEFAVTLLLMFNHRKVVEVQAKYSALLAPEKKERSGLIKEWLDDPFTIQKWQPFLTPKMQTSYLRLLKKENPAWTSRKLINRELSRRK